MREVGHGVFGIRSGLKTFGELQLVSECTKDAFVEIEAAYILGDDDLLPPTYAYGEDAFGSDGASSTFFYGWDEEFEGEALDIVSVSLVSETLTQAKTDSDCISTEGTFFYDLGVGFLRVHLTGGASPAGLSVRVTTVFRFCTGGLSGDMGVQPVLGPEFLTNGQFDALGSWTEDKSGAGWSSARSSSDPIVDTGYLLIATTGAATGYASRYQAVTGLTIGRRYRFFGYYQTPVDQDRDLTVYVRVGTTTSLRDDGKCPEASLLDGNALVPTAGKVRAYCFDFVAHETDARVWLRLVGSAGDVGSVKFDEVSVREIRGWARYHPRIAASGIPDVSSGCQDVYPGGATTGNGVIKLVNGDDGTLYKLFSATGGRAWVNTAVRVRFGGAFIDGQEILLNDMPIGVSGLLSGDQPISGTDSEVDIQVESVRSIMETLLPIRVFDDTGEKQDAGRPKPLVFGTLLGTRPSRRSVDGSTGYGVYVYCDTTDWPAGTGGVGAPDGAGQVYAYLDEDSASKEDSTKRVALDSTKGDYSRSKTAGTISITHDVRLIEITDENNMIDFSLPLSATFAAKVPNGIYYIGDGAQASAANRRGLLAALRSAMETAAGSPGTINCTYSETTHLVTLSRTGGGNLSLFWNTGVNKAVSIGPTLGFDGNADDSGATSYTGPTALFTTPDDHIVRADVIGFIDDSAGSYSGIIDGAIYKAPDVMRWLLQVILKFPESRIDTDSFVAARSTASQVLKIYLGGLASVTGGGGFQLSMQDIVDRFENGAFADVVLDGGGTFFWKQRSSTVPDDAPRLYDRDYLDFRGFFVAGDVYSTVRVNYDQNPATGVVKGVENFNTDTLLRDTRPHFRTFDTFLSVGADATTAATNLAALSRAAIRHFEIRVKGKLLNVKIGDVIYLTRDRAILGVSGTELTDGVFRVMWFSKNFMTHEVRAIVHTNIVS